MPTYDITISEKRAYTLTVNMCSTRAPLLQVYTTVFSLHKNSKTFRESDYPAIGFNQSTNSPIYRKLYFDLPLQYGVEGPFAEYTVPAGAEMRRAVVLPDRINLFNSAAEQSEKWSRPATYSLGKVKVVFPYGTTSTGADDFDNPSLFRYYVWGQYGNGPSDYTELVSGRITLTFGSGGGGDDGDGGGGDGNLNVCGVTAA